MREISESDVREYLKDRIARLRYDVERFSDNDPYGYDVWGPIEGGADELETFAEHFGIDISE